MGTYLLGHSSYFAEIPTYWLDNSTFIYAKYLFSPINIEIRKGNIYDKSDKILCTIDSVKDSFDNGKFHKDNEGNLIFYDSNKAHQFIENISHFSQINLISESIGYDFETRY